MGVKTWGIDLNGMFKNTEKQVRRFLEVKGERGPLWPCSLPMGRCKSPSPIFQVLMTSSIICPKTFV